VSGEVSGGTNGGGFAVARLNADGSLDTSFDGDGRAVVPFPESGTTFSFARGRSLAVPPHGGIVLAGLLSTRLRGPPRVARLTASGALDTSFGTGGRARVTVPNGITFFSDPVEVAVQSDRRIVLAWTVSGSGVSQQFLVARLTASGALDPSFDSDGLQTI